MSHDSRDPEPARRRQDDVDDADLSTHTLSSFDILKDACRKQAHAHQAWIDDMRRQRLTRASGAKKVPAKVSNLLAFTTKPKPKRGAS